MQKVILASGSKQRQNLFSALSIPFEIQTADIDEKAIRDPDLKVQVAKIARAKAEEVAKKYEGIIIAADTFAVCGGEVLEKPKDLDEAFKMLKQQQGKEVLMYTGLCYIDREHNIDFSEVSITKLKMRQLDDYEIEAYVNNAPVTTWAGAFSISYAYGPSLVEYIEGSLTSVGGLPMELLIPLLKKSGLKPIATAP
ncbi:MAG: Maf family protein [Candidatus Doudnabacteria bacterium]